jgi:4'-phosphopantetheinyl transferase
MTNRGAPRQAAAADRVDLWYVDFADVGDELLADYDALIDAEERARRDRFVFERDRRAYAVSHALVRTVLSAYADVAPDRWRFEANAYGRPEITGSEAQCGVRFNLSHSRGAALLGVIHRREIGVDIESVERSTECVSLADRYFSPVEVTDLMRLAESRRRDAFFDYWTLKEAYIKARGMGLAIPLDQFSFDLSTPGGTKLTCDARLNDDGEQWRFGRWSPDPRFRAAVAVRCRPEEGLNFTVRRYVPLGDCGEGVELDVRS